MHNGSRDNRSDGNGSHGANGSHGGDDGLLIDCGTCVMRQTDACADCVVTFLYSEDHELPETGPLAVVLDLGEIRALRALGEAGLVPTLRHRASG